MGGGNERVAASTFRLGLLEESDLRDSLTIRPPKGMHQLMRRIKEYNKLEDDQLQGKGKASASLQYHKEYHPEKFQQKDGRKLRAPSVGLTPWTEGVNVTFKEPFYKILERIKNEPYFRWPGKMGGDPTRRNQCLYCTYHREKGHTIEQCCMLKDHLEQLVKAGHLKEFLARRSTHRPGIGKLK